MYKEYVPKTDCIIEKKDLQSAAPLALSFVGDGVHTLFVRARLFRDNPYHNNDLHNLSSSEVCANKQAKLADKMEKLLKEDELFIYKKGKNAKVNSVPKHAELIAYKKATAFEAVIGYLYLAGENDRLAELLDAIYAEENVTE